MAIIKDFRHKILIINVENNKQTQVEIKNLGLDKMNLQQATSSA